VSVMRLTSPSCLLLTGLAALLQGCQQPPARPASATRLYATDQAGGAKSCTVSPVTAPAPGKETTVTMTVGNDGGWCAITVANDGHPYAAQLLTARPAHGHVFYHPVGDATRIDYTPNAGYGGSDSFTVRLLPGEGLIRANVTVTKAG